QVRLVGISAEGIVDGNLKLTLGLVWSVISHWQMEAVTREMQGNVNTNNLEKTILAWCRYSTVDYEGVDIRDFTNSWVDGLALCAILNRWCPDALDFKMAASMEPLQRLDYAFSVASRELNVTRLLDPEGEIPSD
ncbi:unnamed protein product, partial [Cyprideis torosa]